MSRCIRSKGEADTLLEAMKDNFQNFAKIHILQFEVEKS